MMTRMLDSIALGPSSTIPFERCMARPGISIGTSEAAPNATMLQGSQGLVDSRPSLCKCPNGHEIDMEARSSRPRPGSSNPALVTTCCRADRTLYVNDPARAFCSLEVCQRPSHRILLNVSDSVTLLTGKGVRDMVGWGQRLARL